MENHEQKYNEALLRAKKVHDGELTISPNEVNDFNVYEYIFPELRESEDERIRKHLISRIRDFGFGDDFFDAINTKGNILAWLEKQGEQKPDFCHHEVDLSNCSEYYRKAYYDGWNNCNQQHAQLEAEQKPTWSEEDEGRFQSCLNILQEKGFMRVGVIETINSKWLQSLKDRISQPHWKPSEEQLEALWDAIPNIPNSEKDIDTITELSALYEELKNL